MKIYKENSFFHEFLTLHIPSILIPLEINMNVFETINSLLTGTGCLDSIEIVMMESSVNKLKVILHTNSYICIQT